MNYKGHLTGGIVMSIPVAVITLVFSAFDWITGVICGISTLWFALHPDLDIASKPSRYAYLIGIPAIIYLVYAGHQLEGVLTLLFITVPKIFPHRGLVHTLKFGLLSTVCWVFILMPFIDVNNYFIIGAGMIGYLTHLILDTHVRL